MSTFLQRLGLASFRRRRLVLAAWILALVAIGAGAGAAGGQFSTEFRIPGTEAQAALEQLDREFPQAGVENATARLVFAAPRGERLTQQDFATIGRVVERVATVEDVASAASPQEQRTVSPDGRIAFSTVTFSVPANDLLPEDRDRIVEAVDATAGDRLTTALSSAGTPSGEQEGIPPELIGVAVALVVLAVTFGSMVAAGLPLLTALLGVSTGLAGVMLLAAFVDLSQAVVSIAAMLGLAVGIDYALFILSRHRTQVHQGMPIERSVGLAIGTAGSAVVFAGAMVVIALVALSVSGVPFLTWMGLCAAATVALAVLIAITLVPALLGFAGERAVRGKQLDEQAGTSSGPQRLGARWVGLVLRYRPLAVIVPVAITAALAIPALHLRLGLPDDSSAAPGTQERIAYDLVADGFGPGFNGPLVAVASLPEGADPQRALGALQQRLSAFPGVAVAAPQGVSPNGSTAILSIVPRSGPSAEQTVDLVNRIRDAQPAIRRETGAGVQITGQTALNIDVAAKMGRALPPYVAVVVGLALVLLTIAFRSLLVPLTAVIGFLLTIGAALGAMVGVFQDGFGASLLGVAETAPIVSLIPILMIGILFGLAMDYQVFLVSRMHEAHAHGADPQQAVREGFTQSARVVTAAALIMISVFAGFVLPDDPIIKSVGFALTLGIIIDAFLIRMTLIPAVMSYLGRHAWRLPGWLGRVLPDVDIEGRALERAEGDDEVARAEDADPVPVTR